MRDFKVGDIVRRKTEKRYQDDVTVPAGSIGVVVAITPAGRIKVWYEELSPPARLSDPSEFKLAEDNRARTAFRAGRKSSRGPGDRVHALRQIGSGNGAIPKDTCGTVVNVLPGGSLIVDFDSGNPRRRILGPDDIAAGCPGG